MKKILLVICSTITHTLAVNVYNPAPDKDCNGLTPIQETLLWFARIRGCKDTVEGGVRRDVVE